MRTNLDLKIEGQQGAFSTWQDNKGKVVAFVNKSEGFITVDAFIGQGETYKQRDEVLITIGNVGNRVWEGTFKQLLHLIK